MAAVLVAYATKYGSTREVAEAVAEQLRQHDLNVDVRPASDVRNVADYSAVVVGGALYFFRWRRHARAMLARNRKGLVGRPVAVFGMGPLEDTPEQFAGARGHLDRALAKVAWLSPVSIAVFGGRLDPSVLRFPDNNPAMRNMPASDLRDWDAIKAWADTLPDAFSSARAAGADAGA